MTQHPEHYPVQAMDDDMISLSEIAAILFRGKHWVIGSTLAFLAAALCYLFVVKPVYQASTLIKIERYQTELLFDLLGVEFDIKDKANAPSGVAVAIATIKSAGFVREVATLLEKQSASQSGQNNPASLQGTIQATEEGKNSGILKLTVTGTNPEANLRELNAVIESYFEYRGLALANSIDRSVGLLNGRLIKINAELRLHAGLKDTDQQSDQLTELRQAQTYIQTKIDILKNAKKIALSDRSVLSAPVAHEAPISPKYTLVIVLATMLGGMLGIVLVFVREVMRPVLHNAEQVENKTGLPVLATITGKADAKAGEGFRILRTSLLYHLTTSGNNRVVVTSTDAGSGKQYILTRLADALGKADKKVLLVDADLHNGELLSLLGMQSGCDLSKGFGQEDNRLTVNDHVDIIASSEVYENAAELLMKPGFKSMLERLSEQYDVVLIHTPPVLSYVDAAIVGEQCGTCLMVLREGKTSPKAVDAARVRLKQAGVAVDGAILNGVK